MMETLLMLEKDNQEFTEMKILSNKIMQTIRSGANGIYLADNLEQERSFKTVSFNNHMMLAMNEKTCDIWCEWDKRKI